MTGKEISQPIYRFLYNQGGGIHQCGQIMTANLNENPSSYECQLDSMIQGAGTRAEKERE